MTDCLTIAPGAVNCAGWTQLIGTATVSGSGTLTSARPYIETTPGYAETSTVCPRDGGKRPASPGYPLARVPAKRVTTAGQEY
jgi:hypothetical protein